MDFIKLDQLDSSSTSAGAFQPFEKAEIEQSLVARFEAQVTRYPEHVAIAQRGQKLTYEALNGRANQVARAILTTAVVTQQASAMPIVVLIEQGAQFMSALLGVLKAGHFYVPVDPAFPEDRNAYITAQSETQLIVTCQRHSDMAARLAPDGCEILMLDVIDPATAEDNLDVVIAPEALVNIIYTSGSTGNPKGVVHSHRNLLHNCRNYTNPMRITASDRMTLLHSCSVMGAVNGIFNALLNGAALYPYDLKTEGLANLPAWLLENKITVYYSVVTLFRHFVDFLATTPFHNETFEHLRLIRLGGEAVFGKDIDRYQQQFSNNCLLYIGLGSTETGAIKLFIADKNTRLGSKSLPLGDSVDDMAVLLLDENKHRVAPGDIGEICVQSPYLALGYWQDAKRTNKAFLPDPDGGNQRIYRTGDLGQYQPDGTLVHRGRKDFQIKIRGYRVEIGEVETALLKLDQVKAVTVIGDRDAAGANRLVAYFIPTEFVVAQQDPTFAAALRNQVAERLPDYMVPAGFVLLDAFPLTPNGKVNRRALPKPTLQQLQTSQVVYVAPRTPVEESLVDIWSTVLARPNIGIYDNFFELGGHSLSATQVAARIQMQYQVQLPLSALFESPTIAELALAIQQAIEESEPSESEPLDARNDHKDSGLAPDSHLPQGILVPQRREATVAPLSFAQQRLWLLQQLEPDSHAYHMTRAYRLRGALNTAALQQALSKIVERHEILRTQYITTDGVPQQVISPQSAFVLETRTITPSAIQQTDTQVTIQSILESAAAQTFDLTIDLPIRATLIRVNDQEHVLQVVMHHIASDGWSMGVFTRELKSLYAAYAQSEAVQQPSLLADLPIQYADFAQWQRQWLSGRRLSTQIDYWKTQLTGAAPLLELPTDHPRPLQPSHQGRRFAFTLEASLSAKLKLLSQQNNSTLFMTLIAAFNILLYRYSKQTDIVVGSPIANRNLPELEGLIGFFANILPLRTQLSSDRTFRQLLTQIRQVSLDAYAHQDLPFEKLVEALQPERNRSYSPIFQVMFILQNTPENDVEPLQNEAATLSLNPESVENTTAKFDLTLAMREGITGLQGTLEYSTDLYEAATVERMVAHFEVLLAAVVADPDSAIGTLPILPTAERNQLLVGWNQTQADYPQGLCIHQLFERQVEKTPDAIALTFPDASQPDASANQTLTYKTLNERANQLAHYLQTLGVGPEKLVGIALDRSPAMLIGLLAILKAGGSYVPLDPSYPAERLAYMVEHSQLAILLTEKAYLSQFLDQSVQLVDIDDCAILQASTHNPHSSVSNHNLAYTIYTSGSTGKPKGVQIEHRAAVNFLQSMAEQPGLCASDRLLAVTTISFDIAVLELYLPLMVGAQVVLASREIATDAAKLSTLLACSGATVMQATPATWQMLLAGDWLGQPQLKMLCGGEALPPELAEQLLSRGRSLWNMYGPTEATVWTAACEITADHGQRIPVAGPVANTQLYVLEAEERLETGADLETAPQDSQAGSQENSHALRLLPIGIPGEVHIGGVGLARGYLNRPDITAERFIPDPFSAQPNARLYKTGDLARWLPDGTLEFLGRIDNQVKVRGFRIELGEIETALTQHAAVQRAIVIAREDTAGDKRLVAYWLKDAAGAKEQAKEPTEQTAADFRDFLSQTLPGYMLPAAFVLLEAFPLTPNGKIDRRALPQPDSTALQSTTQYVAPRNPKEQQLADIWADVLNLEQVGIHDNFFELGGHSLLAAQVIARIQSLCKQTIPLAQLFETPTVARLAGVSPSAESADAIAALPIIRPAINPGETRAPAKLSFAQQRLWLLHQLEPDNNAYHMTRTLRLRGPLNVTALQQAFTTIVERHEALRTHFIAVEGVPQQVVSAAQPFALPLVDLSDLSSPADTSSAAAANTLSQQLENEAYRLFDLSTDLMLRATLYRITSEEHVLQFVMHHIASDGWSRSVFTQELTTLYNAYAQGQPNPLTPLTLQYADFAEWQRHYLAGDILQTQLSYWEQQLAGAPPLLELPTDRPRPLQPTYQGRRLSFTLPNSLAERLKALSQQNGATLFMTLLTAFNTLLYRYSGQTDIVVGSPIANRPQKELEPLIGLFLNTLVLRTNLDGDPTFTELLGRVKQMALEAYAHQNLPFEQLLETLQPSRDLSYSPWFQVLFVLQNTPQVSQTLGDLTVQKEPIAKTTAKFDITLSMSERADGLKGVFEYSTDLFEPETAERMVAHFQVLLASIVAEPNRAIATLPILTPAEQQHLTQPPLLAAAPTGCIHHCFEAQVQRTPNAIAIQHESNTSPAEQLTYQALNQRANQLAYYLTQLGVGPDTLVGICLTRSTDMLVGVLGILKAGGAYVPLDPAYPAERLAMMVDDAAPQVIVTSSTCCAALLTRDSHLVCLDTDQVVIAQQPSDNIENDASAENLAYVIYTSGSTGKPKGVMIEHRALVNFTLAATEEYGISKRDRILQFASLNFDAAAEEIFPALCAGATLILRTDEMLSSPAHFMAECDRLALTVLDLPTAYWHQLTAHFPASNTPVPPALRLVIIGGEAALPTQLQNWQAWLSASSPNAYGPLLINTYGPTEATVVTTCYPIPPRVSSTLSTGGQVCLPIGKSLSNVDTYLLDEHLQPVPTGVAGEVLIGGFGLARGYLNREDLTRDRFIPHPFSSNPNDRLYKTGDLACYLPDGNLKFLGRRDDQVKIRGFRIELGDVETAIAQHPAVKECVVLVREDNPGDKRLVGYLVPTAEGIDNAALRHSLQQQLPAYMVPVAFVQLDALPFTPSNKVDRRALPAPAASDIQTSAAYVAPRNLQEQQLADIWADVLHLEKVGIHDNFFELGGHSLIATQVIARMQSAGQGQLPLARLFESPTVAELANLLMTAADSEHGSADPLNAGAIAQITPRQTTEPVPLSLAQQRLWFLQQLEPTSSAYHMLRIIRLRGSLQPAAIQQAFNTLLQRHEALRTCFVTEQGVPQQVVTPAPHFDLPMIDLRQAVGDDPVEQLTAQLESNARRPFDLSADLMLRATLICLSPTEHVLQIVIHHIACDGWSMGVLTQEFNALYAAYAAGKPNPLTALPLQYADFSEWQRQWLAGDVLETQLTYWEQQLTGAPPLLELPTDRPRPAQSANKGAQLSFQVPALVTHRLKALSQDSGATLFMTLLTAFNTLLYRYSGQTDIIVGSPIANRPQKELESLIGLFLNTLVLRTDLSGEPSFKDLLNRVKQTALEAYAHQDVPFEQLLETLNPERDLSYSPWFQVMFILQNTPQSSQQLADLSLTTEHIQKTTAKFDLTLSMSERVDAQQNTFLKGTLEFSTELFDTATIERMLGHFQTLLAAIATQPDASIATLPMVTPEERQQLLFDWNETPAESLRLPSTSRCIHQHFESQVARTPDAIALQHQDRTLTYQQLNSQANRLAHQLIALGIGPDDLVGLCVPRSCEMVIGLLGILKAGGAYVPLDPTYPAERLAMMVNDAQPQAIVTLQTLKTALPPQDISTLFLDAASATDSDLAPVTNPNNTRTQSHHLAYIIYTSGSTGKPKGVMIEHRALVNFMLAATEKYGISESDRTLQFASLNFDAAAEEIFPTLCAGATLVLRTDDMLSSPTHFMAECDRLALSVLDLPTAYWHQLTANLSKSTPLPPALRLVIIGGESALPTQLHNWQAWLNAQSLTSPLPLLINTYGPTEATVVATCYSISAYTQTTALNDIPIGTHLPAVQTYLLDHHLQPVPVGIAGELYIGGDSLARGYLNREELTRDRFIPHPFSDEPNARLYKTGDLACYLPDGTLRFLGRRDDQVKIRGFRIELGDVETALGQHPAVQQCTVLVREDIPGDKQLVSYIVTSQNMTSKQSTQETMSTQGGAAPSIRELRQFLQQRLPNYMVPSAFVHLAELPLTPSNKVDRRALPAPTLSDRRADEPFVAPTTLLEQQIAHIWADILVLEKVSIHDNFFELGGNSLLAAQVIARIQTDCQVTLPLATLFETPTISALAARCQQGADPANFAPLDADSLLVLLKQGDTRQPLFLIHEADGDISLYGNLAATLKGDRAIYAVKPRARNGFPMAYSHIEAIAADYRQQIQSIQPHGPYLLGGLCIGGVLSFEIALQLEEQGEPVALVAMLDSVTRGAQKRVEYKTHVTRSQSRKVKVAIAFNELQKGLTGWVKIYKAVARKTQKRVLYETSLKADYWQTKFFRQFFDGAHTSMPQLLQGLTVRKILVFAVQDYYPRARLKGKALLVKAAFGVTPDRPAYRDIYADPQLGWGKRVTQPLSLYDVSGGHNSMLGIEKISEVENILSEAIQAATDTAE